MNARREYRDRIRWQGLERFWVCAGESDLLIIADRQLQDVTLERLIRYRLQLRGFIDRHPGFRDSLEPVEIPGRAPLVVRMMAEAGESAGVGPMAAVAGTLAHLVGIDLLEYTSELLVENGGDIYMSSERERVISVFAGESPLSERVGIRIRPDASPIGICTSAGTVGHSHSCGSADAAVAISTDTALADAVATGMGNRVRDEGDVEAALDYARGIVGITGGLVIRGETLGAFGAHELVPL